MLNHLSLLQCVSLVVLGMYSWELVTTFGFDLGFLTKRRPFSWHYIPYFICKYCVLGGLLGFQLFEYATPQMNCQAIYVISGVMGNVAIGAASINLAIRTIAIWLHNRYVLLLLGLFAIAQWIAILRDVAIRDARWNEHLGACFPIGAHDPLKEFAFLYFPTMVFDLTVLIFNVIGILRQGRTRSPLQTIVFAQGTIYFILSFVSNLIPAILGLTQVNLQVALLFTFPASFISVVASCRLVRSLAEYAECEQKRSTSSSYSRRYGLYTSRAPELSTHIPPISSISDKDEEPPFVFQLERDGALRRTVVDV